MFKKKFNKLFPVIIDLETAGDNEKNDALLEIAAVTVKMYNNRIIKDQTLHYNIESYRKKILNTYNLKYNYIVPHNPFRFAVSEYEAIKNVSVFIKKHTKQADCNNSILVGHNIFFDIKFFKETLIRNNLSLTFFHNFTYIDTSSLGMLMYNEKILHKLLLINNIKFNYKKMHSSMYDAEKTTELFCCMFNKYI